MFRDAYLEFDKAAQNDPDRLSSFTKYKFKKKSQIYYYHKIKLILQLQLIHGPLYIRVQLHKYKIAKNLFQIEIQGGNDSYIPIEMSLRRLPTSFKYYDPVLIIVRTLMPQVRKQFYGLKNALQLYYANNSAYDQFRKKLGFFPNTKGVIGDLNKGTEKLTYKTESHTNY